MALRRRRRQDAEASLPARCRTYVEICISSVWRVSVMRVAWGGLCRLPVRAGAWRMALMKGLPHGAAGLYISVRRRSGDGVGLAQASGRMSFPPALLTVAEATGAGETARAPAGENRERHSAEQTNKL